MTPMHIVVVADLEFQIQLVANRTIISQKMKFNFLTTFGLLSTT